MKTMKGQAAMEYLMTYGWALLAIVIVIAALIYLNPFRAPEICLFQQQGFSCSEPNPQLYVDTHGDLNMNVRVWNRLGQTVEIDSVMCTSSPSSDISYSDATSHDETVFTGSSTVVEGLECVDSEGDVIEMSPNQEFRGRLIVWYNYADDIDKSIKHQAQANVISLVVEETT